MVRVVRDGIDPSTSGLFRPMWMWRYLSVAGVERENGDTSRLVPRPRLSRVDLVPVRSRQPESSAAARSSCQSESGRSSKPFAMISAAASTQRCSQGTVARGHTRSVCPPDYFTADFVINPWMAGQEDSLDLEVAKRRWTELRSVLSMYAEIAVITPQAGLPDRFRWCLSSLAFQSIDDGGHVLDPWRSYCWNSNDSGCQEFCITAIVDISECRAATGWRCSPVWR
jgi:hypothetical protein